MKMVRIGIAYVESKASQDILNSVSLYSEGKTESPFVKIVEDIFKHKENTDIITAYRVEKGPGKLRKNLAKYNVIGNPIEWAGKTKGQATLEFIEWLEGTGFTDLEQSYRTALLAAIKSGKLKGLTIEYYTDLGQPSHATVLDYYINRAEAKSEVSTELLADKNVFTVTPTKEADKKAVSKAKMSTQFIGHAEGIPGSSTALYAEQAGEVANTGVYKKGDVVFVSVPGKRGKPVARRAKQKQTVEAAINALEQGATLLTDNAGYVSSSNYNEGERLLAKRLEEDGYSYSEIVKDGHTIGVWNKTEEPASKTINIYSTEKNGFEELSNFAHRPFNVNEEGDLLKGSKFNNVESAFQAYKLIYSDYYSFPDGSARDETRDVILKKLEESTGREAKKIGRQIKGLNVEEWNRNSFEIMKGLLLESFKQNPEALKLLLSTDDAILTHTQDKTKWAKEFPKILMEVREDLKPKKGTTIAELFPEVEPENLTGTSPEVINENENITNEEFLDLLNNGGEEGFYFEDGIEKAFLETSESPEEEEPESNELGKYELFPGVFANEGQKEAIDVLTKFALSDKGGMYMLKGRGGTGKTTIIRKITEGLPFGLSVNYYAPTHVAAQVLSRAIDGPASTIASGLGYKMNEATGKFYQDPYAKKSITTGLKIAIIDEASMINDEGFELLKKFTDNGGKIIFMGDNVQLPPVGNKDSEKDSDAFTSPTVELTERMRQQDTSPILPITDVLAEAVESKSPKKRAIEDRSTIFDTATNTGVIFENTWQDFADMWEKDFRNNPFSTRVITFNNNKHSSKTSVKNLNSALRRIINPNEPREFVEGELLTAYASFGEEAPEIINSVSYVVKEVLEEEKEYDTLTVHASSKALGNRTIKLPSLKITTVYLQDISSTEGGTVMADLLSRESKAKLQTLANHYFKGTGGVKKDGQMGFKILEKFPDLDYGYVTNAHKAQGATLRNVYVIEDNILGPTGPRSSKVANQALYVATSRASDKLVVVSQKNDQDKGFEVDDISPAQNSHLDKNDMGKYSLTDKELKELQDEEKDRICKPGKGGSPIGKAKYGYKTSFTEGGNWALVEDLKGMPSHKSGGVQLSIGQGGVNFTNGDSKVHAKDGMVLPGDNRTVSEIYASVTGKPWDTAKEQGFTTGTYDDNIALLHSLTTGRFNEKTYSKPVITNYEGDFNSAFGKARESLGGSKIFKWNNKLYTTDLKNEVPAKGKKGIPVISEENLKETEFDYAPTLEEEMEKRNGYSTLDQRAIPVSTEQEVVEEAPIEKEERSNYGPSLLEYRKLARQPKKNVPITPDKPSSWEGMKNNSDLLLDLYEGKRPVPERVEDSALAGLEGKGAAIDERTVNYKDITKTLKGERKQIIPMPADIEMQKRYDPTLERLQGFKNSQEYKNLSGQLEKREEPVANGLEVSEVVRGVMEDLQIYGDKITDKVSKEINDYTNSLQGSKLAEAYSTLTTEGVEALYQQTYNYIKHNILGDVEEATESLPEEIVEEKPLLRKQGPSNPYHKLGNKIPSHTFGKDYYIQPFYADLDSLAGIPNAVGVRNRLDKQDIEGMGVASTFNRFQPASNKVIYRMASYTKERPAKETAYVLAVDPKTNSVKAGLLKDFRGTDYLVSPIQAIPTKTIRSSGSKSKLAPYSNEPALELINPNGEVRQQWIGLGKNNKGNAVGGYSGGNLLISSPDGEHVRTVSGTGNNLKYAFEDFKKKYKLDYANILMLDAKAYTQMIASESGKLSSKNLKGRDYFNSAGGHFMWINNDLNAGRKGADRAGTLKEWETWEKTKKRYTFDK